MTEENQQKRSHFLLGNLAHPEPFRPKGGGSPSAPPARERKQHGNHLLGQIQQLKPVMDEARQIQEFMALRLTGLAFALNLSPLMMLNSPLKVWPGNDLASSCSISDRTKNRPVPQFLFQTANWFILRI